MNIRQHSSDTPARKHLKVTLSTDLLVNLHRLKILTGKAISDTVSDALEAYFAEIQAARNSSQGSSSNGPMEIGGMATEDGASDSSSPMSVDRAD